MKYTIQTINPNDKFLFFWGHTPSKDEFITKTCFSQWWLCSFSDGNDTYPTAEHWMMAKKALLFNDIEIFERIMLSKKPAEAKKLGRLVNGFDETKWNENRFEIVKQGNFLKYSQNKELKNFLLNTGSRVIVEASPLDRIWGIGLASDQPQAQNPSLWNGLNLLGFALMEVRDMLKN